MEPTVSTPTPAAAPAPAPEAPKMSATTGEPRNFLVTFLLACSFGVFGLRHFYLGNNKLGWIRTGLAVGGYLWMIIMAMLGQFTLTFIGLLAFLVAGVWAIVDFFYVYNAVKTDANGQQLTITARDKKWAKVIYIVVIALCAASIAFSFLGASLVENSFRNAFNNTNYNYNTDNSDTNYEFTQPDSYQFPEQSN